MESENIDNQTSTTIQETVQFVDANRETEISTLTKPQELEQSELKQTIQERYTHELANFLARPIKIASFKYLTTHGINSELLTLNFPEAYTTQTMYLEKLAGFVAFRGTMKVDIYSNAQPFQTGLIRAAYVPNAQAMPNKTTTLVGNVCSFTTLPNVSCLLPDTTSFSVSFPFVSNHTGINLISGEGEFGRLFVHSITELRSVAVNDVNFTVFVSLQDAQFEFPTGAAVNTRLLSTRQIIALNLLSDKSMNLTSLKEFLDFKHLQKKWAPSVSHIRSVFPVEYIQQPVNEEKVESEDHFVAQGKTPNIPAIPNFESVPTNAPLAGMGTVTKSLLAISGVSAALSLVPVLTPFAAPIAAVSGALGGVAALFGWSKSANLKDTVFTKPISARHMANVNGEDNSSMMALCTGNSLDQDPGVFGTSLDEMAFSVMGSTPAVIKIFGWSTSDTPDELLDSYPVTPCLNYNITTNEVAMPMMAYIQNCFTLWRGSINFIFTVPATKYHKGRLRFTFVPGHRNHELTGVDINKCYSSILDIQQSNVMHLNVPYISTADWMYADFSSVVPNQGLDYGDENSVTGMLFVQVLNPLVAPDTVSNYLDVVLEVCAGPDMQRAIPRAPVYVPSSTQLATKMPDNCKYPDNDDYEIQGSDFIAQGIDDNDLPAKPLALTRNDYQSGKVPPPIGGAEPSDPTSFRSARMCIGESILSCRALIKRFTKIYQSSVIRPSNDTSWYSILPYAKMSPVNSYIASYFDDYSYWSYPFAFARGSMRFKIKWSPTNGTEYAPRSTAVEAKLLTDPGGYCFSAVLNTYTATDTPVKTQTFLFPALGSSLAQISDQNVEGVTELAVPFYNRFHTIPLEINQLPSVANVRKGDFPPTILAVRSTHRECGGYVDIYRGTGDDFSFGYLCGSPIMIRTHY